MIDRIDVVYNLIFICCFSLDEAVISQKELVLWGCYLLCFFLCEKFIISVLLGFSFSYHVWKDFSRRAKCLLILFLVWSCILSIIMTAVSSANRLNHFFVMWNVINIQKE